MKKDLKLINFVVQNWSEFSAKIAFDYKFKNHWETITYGLLMTKFSAYGEYLSELGVVPGEKVVLLPGNTVDHIIALLGIMSVGAIPCLVDGQLPKETLEDQCKVFQSRLVIGSSSLKQKCPVNHIRYLVPNDFTDQLPLAEPKPRGLDDGIALILLTSGTGGDYRVVCHSHAGIIQQIKRSMSTVPPETFIHPSTLFFLPYFHIYPLVNNLLPALYSCGRTLLVTEINRLALAEGFARIKPRVIVVVPRILEMIEQGIKEQLGTLLSYKKVFANLYFKFISFAYHYCKWLLPFLNRPFRKRFGGELKVIFCGGATLDLTTQEFIEKLIAPVFTGYGLTETAGACVANSKDYAAFGTLGRVLPGCEVKINHPNEEGEGEVFVKTDAMMLGYLQDGKIVQAFDDQGWYHTGDLGKFDVNNCLIITDRIKDLLVTPDGKKVSPVMLENQYKHIPHIKEMIVVGLKLSQTDAMKICAMVVPTSAFRKKEILTALFNKASELPHQYQLQDIYFVKEIIKTNTLKVQRNKNMQMLLNTINRPAAQMTLASLPPTMPLDEKEAITQIVHMIGQVLHLHQEQIDISKNLLQLGMDSISFSDFYILLLEKYKVNLSLEKIYVLSLTELANIISNPVDGDLQYTVDSYIPELEKDISVVGLKLTDNLAETILLTGVTGFLGAFILRDLMLHTKAKVICLVRADSDAAAKDRVVNNCEKYLVWNDEYSDRLHVVVGDLARSNFGVSQEQYDELSASVDSIIHSAAKVNFLESFEALYQDNVNVVQELLRFATRKKLKVVEYVSTFSVLLAGKDKLLDECEVHTFPKLGLGYTQSKWAAEQLLYKAKNVGIPVNIYRPGIITGDSVNGLYNQDDLFINMKLNSLQIQKYIQSDVPIYIVPVDLVSLSIVKLTMKRSVGNIYHLFGSIKISFAALMKRISKHFVKLSPVTKDEWFNAVIKAVKEGKESTLHRYLPLFLNDPDQRFLNDLIYLSDAQLSAEKTNQILLAEGIDGKAFTKDLIDLYIRVLGGGK
jgi:thioester reductase-like protein